VSAQGVDDYVFRNPEPVHFVEGTTVFDGTSGLVRVGKDKCEFALFHGTRLGVSGITFITTDTEFGIGGFIVSGQAPSGQYYALTPTSMKIAMPSLSEKMMVYVDGEAREARRESDAIILDLEEGLHHWELTEKLPVPVAPRILRTENHAGGARAIAAPVAAAAQYRFELSKDGGVT
jgi:hypothetical protein